MPFLRNETQIIQQVNYDEVDGYVFLRSSGTCRIIVIHAYRDEQGNIDPLSVIREEVPVSEPDVIERMTRLITNNTLANELYTWAVAYAKAHGAIPEDAEYVEA